MPPSLHKTAVLRRSRFDQAKALPVQGLNRLDGMKFFASSLALTRQFASGREQFQFQSTLRKIRKACLRQCFLICGSWPSATSGVHSFVVMAGRTGDWTQLRPSWPSAMTLVSCPLWHFPSGRPATLLSACCAPMPTAAGLHCCKAYSALVTSTPPTGPRPSLSSSLFFVRLPVTAAGH